MSARKSADGTVRATVLAPTVITTAVAGTVGPITVSSGACSYALAQANLTYGSGGTTIDAYVQTSVDGGVTWTDIMNFNFTTASARKFSSVNLMVALTGGTAATDATLASNTVVNGLLGDRFRVKYKSTGTYAGNTTLQVDIVTK